MTGQDWRHRARCRQADPELFFGADKEREPARKLREARAKAVCAACPVLDDCRAYALAAGSDADYGIWAGLTEGERRDIRREQRRRSA